VTTGDGAQSEAEKDKSAEHVLRDNVHQDVIQYGLFEDLGENASETGTRSTDEEQVISHRDLYFNSDTGHGTLEFRKSATSRTDFQEVSHSEHLYYESIHSENLYDESCAFRLQNLSGRQTRQ
jgi:hypothetical protein